MLLAIETATDVCSVALLAGERVLGVAEALRPRAHAELLAPLVHDLLAQHGVRAADLQTVAVSAGPGSYTGLRIGVSTAKGLCIASGAGLVGVPTLAALATAASGVLREGDLLVTALPSRRGEVYVAAFRPDGARLAEAAPAAALTLDELGAWLPAYEDVLWLLGDAAPLALEALARPARVLGAPVFRPHAVLVARLAAERAAAGDLDDVAAFEPAYLKPFEARVGRSIFDSPTT
jgi:tRNA threonylcarbamoyladenosine biosynthesis protein TsaB